MQCFPLEFQATMQGRSERNNTKVPRLFGTIVPHKLTSTLLTQTISLVNSAFMAWCKLHLKSLETPLEHQTKKDLKRLLQKFQDCLKQ